VKYSGKTHYSFTDEEVLKVFDKSRDFRKASFKAIVDTLSVHQKQQIIDNLKELETENLLKKELGYNTSGIELVTLVGELAEHFIQIVESERRRVSKFDSYFPTAKSNQEVLSPFVVKITDSNHKDKAEKFLKGYDLFKQTLDQIQEIIEFIESKLSKIERFRNFREHIITELGKLGGKYKTNPIFKLQEGFDKKFNNSVIENYMFLEKTFQDIKDEYHSLIIGEHQQMTKIHGELKTQIQDAISNVKNVSGEPNRDILSELSEIIAYADSHICDNLKIEYEIACQFCNYSLNEIISANQSIGLR